MLGEKLGFTPWPATNVMCLMCLVVLTGLIFKTYCGVRYIGYGDDTCYRRAGERIFRLGEMAGAILKKIFMSSASSAIGTGTVLGMHSALSPDAPTIQGDLREAHVDESKNWLKVDFSGASTFFFIALVISICLILGITLPCCCGCTPHKIKRKREEEKWKKEVRNLMEQRNKEDAEFGLEAEGWTEINKGKGPRLVDPSGV